MPTRQGRALRLLHVWEAVQREDRTDGREPRPQDWVCVWGKKVSGRRIGGASWRRFCGVAAG